MRLSMGIAALLLVGCGGTSPTFVDVIVEGGDAGHVTGADKAPDISGDDSGSTSSQAVVDPSDSGSQAEDKNADSGATPGQCGAGTSMCCQPSGLCGCYAVDLCSCYANDPGCWPADASNPNAPPSVTKDAGAAPFCVQTEDGGEFCSTATPLVCKGITCDPAACMTSIGSQPACNPSGGACACCLDGTCI